MKLEKENKTELSIQQEQEIKYKFIGQLLPNKGHTVFEMNLETGKVQPAEFEKDLTLSFGDQNYNKRIVIKEEHVYCCALNKKNAMKHFRNGTTGNRV